MPARQVVTRFRGWVTFSGTTHDDAAVATLLDEDDYAALLAAADPAGVLTPRHAQTVVGLAAGNASLAKCAAALHGGCTGRLHEFRLHVQADGHALTSAAKVLLDNGRLPTRRSQRRGKR